MPHYSLPSFFLKNNFLIASVIAIHNGMNGVPGPIQNNQHAEPMPNHHLLPVTKPSIYGNHTSILITAHTPRNNTNVFQSLSCANIHLFRSMNFFQRFLKNAFIMLLYVLLIPFVCHTDTIQLFLSLLQEFTANLCSLTELTVLTKQLLVCTFSKF